MSENPDLNETPSAEGYDVIYHTVIRNIPLPRVAGLLFHLRLRFKKAHFSSRSGGTMEGSTIMVTDASRATIARMQTFAQGFCTGYNAARQEQDQGPAQ